jgi:N6-L-threonylcarbamoyladenine synthase
MCEERGCKLFVPDFPLLVDNAGMIGYLGLKMFKSGLKFSVDEVDIRPRERTDDVEVLWK